MTGIVSTYTAVELLDIVNADTAESPITTRTLRYYSSLNLIDAPVSRPGQPGRYTDTHLVQLAAVRVRRAAGRGLAEIAAEFAANPDAATSATTRPVPALTEPIPAGLAMPETVTSTTAAQCWPAGTGSCAPNTAISPWDQRCPSDASNARVITVAPGVQITLTGAAIHDVALVARLTAAASTRTYPYPTTTWNGTIS